ncbi:hypothetical protein SynNOUM97013_01204 [Synechococcus sp. NOUM97013]|nr:hypothetical protein SynNOUM97013_01204 [Synechococcus sp. NOUM97013]
MRKCLAGSAPIGFLSADLLPGIPIIPSVNVDGFGCFARG